MLGAYTTDVQLHVEMEYKQDTGPVLTRLVEDRVLEVQWIPKHAIEIHVRVVSERDIVIVKYCLYIVHIIYIICKVIR